MSVGPRHAANREILARGQWFGALPEPLQWAVVERCRVCTYERGQLLFSKGVASRGLWMVLKGQVLVTDVLERGARVLLHVGGPGFVLGETVVVNDQTTRAEVRASTPLQTLMLPRLALQQLAAQEPALSEALTSLISHRLTSTVGHLASYSAASVAGRLRLRLEQIASLWYEDGHDDPTIELHLTQSDVAGMLGSSRQTVNRALAELAAQGLIEVGFRTIHILPGLTNRIGWSSCRERREADG